MSMPQDQVIELIPVPSLLGRVTALHQLGCRLVQISATRLLDHLELTYSFEREHQLTSLRLHVPATNAQVPSITSIYWCAFLYENEMHDLFDLQVDDLAVDFHGNLYTTAVKYAFGTPPPRPSSPAPKPTASTAAS